MMKVLTVRISNVIKQKLTNLAYSTGRTKTYYVRKALSEYLDEIETFYLAEKRLRNHNPKKDILLEDLLKEYA